MKTYILLLFSILMFSSNGASANTPGNNVPSVISQSLSKKYSGAKITDWYMENNICLVRFEQAKDVYEAAFEKNGEWIRTGKIIKEQKLPREVQMQFEASAYADWKVERAAEVEFAGFGDVKMYEIKVSNGSDGYTLFYNDQAELVMKTYNMQLRVAKK